MLATLGFTRKQEIAYLHLLEFGRDHVEARELSDIPLGESADAAEECFRGLAFLGLVAPLTGGHWLMLPVTEALDALIAEHERRLQRMRAALARHRPDQCEDLRANPDVAQVVTGASDSQQGFHEVVLGATHELRATEATRREMGIIPPNEVTADEVDLLREGCRARVVYDHPVLRSPERLADLAASIAEGEQARVAEVRVRTLLTDRPEGWMPAELDDDEQPVRLRIADGPLLDAIGTYFDMVWERAVPVTANCDVDVDHPAATAPTEMELLLLQLLAAGLTESTIASHLGCHPRTAQQHLHDLCVRLDAGNRFQAGYQAVQRGWFGTS